MLRVRFEIPLIGQSPKDKFLAAALRGSLTQSDFRRVTWDAHLRSLPLTILKPAKRLGATWVSDFVDTGRNVNLCSDCLRKYGNWWTREDYYPAEACTSDCDGCGDVLIPATKFRKRTQGVPQ